MDLFVRDKYLRFGDVELPIEFQYVKLTLKQTHKEKGRVTTTKSQEIHVSKSPHTPTPEPLSSAEKEKRIVL